MSDYTIEHEVVTCDCIKAICLPFMLFVGLYLVAHDQQPAELPKVTDGPCTSKLGLEETCVKEHDGLYLQCYMYPFPPDCSYTIEYPASFDEPTRVAYCKRIVQARSNDKDKDHGRMQLCEKDPTLQPVVVPEPEPEDINELDEDFEPIPIPSILQSGNYKLLSSDDEEPAYACGNVGMGTAKSPQQPLHVVPVESGDHHPEL